MGEKALFSDLIAWFPHQGGHASVLMKKIVQQGGRVEDSLTPAVTHIVCEPQVQRAKLEAVLPQGRALASFQLVKKDYVSESIRLRALQDPAAFRPYLMPAPAPQPEPPVPGPVAADDAVATPASPPPPKRQKVEAVPTPPPRPSSAGTPGGGAAQGPDEDSKEGNGAPEEPCVVARRGAEWVAVQGRLPRFTGGATGLPWGSYGVWTEPYDPVAARGTVDALRDYWYRNAVAPAAGSRPGSASSPPAPAAGSSPGSASSAAAPAPTNGVCEHVACSRLGVCIVAALEAVRATYSPGKKDQFKVKQLQRAQQAVSGHPAPLRRPEDVSSVAGLVGKSAQKVAEVLEVGRVASKVDAAAADGRAAALAALQRVWGAGATVARAWYDRGCRDVDDVRRTAAEGRIALTEQQRCGVTHFEDLQRKIPRAAVAAAEVEVRRAVFEEVERRGAPDGERTFCFATGSFCRGAPETSDIDVLVVLPPSGGGIHCGEFLHAVLGVLLDRGLLLDEMDPRGSARAHRHSPGHASWMGVCRPPGSPAVARIDVKVYGPEHLVCAVNYFANSMEFCRATRHWATSAPAPAVAAKELAPGATGFKVSDQVMVPRGFREGPGGRREEVVLGPPVALASETELFERLGLAYVPPTMRFFHGGYRGAKE